MGHFNPRSPCGERPAPMLPHLLITLFQSTLPVWGATGSNSDFTKSFTISIHAPRVGSDTAKRKSLIEIPTISIHAPRVGSDLIILLMDCLPVDFNPRSPCGERPGINIKRTDVVQDFNPRSPCGERQQEWGQTENHQWISIHAPRVGSDNEGQVECVSIDDFNPRSPCGERRTYDD